MKGASTATLPRRLEREWLDDLPASDPRARRSRRDLRLMNRIMGHAFTLARALRAHVGAARPRIADLGAGDGTLMLRVARKLGWREVDLALVDRQPAVEEATLRAFADAGWRASSVKADVFEWLASAAEHDAIVTSLFLHHFEDDPLARLFDRASGLTRAFIAIEPERARLPLAGSHMVGMLGCNDVTRHDAVLSVRAGFVADELTRLWPAKDGWRLEETRAGLFSHRFVATRA